MRHERNQAVNILLAIDHSDASRKAVRFVGDAFGRNLSGDLSVTLLHVGDSLPEFILSRSADAEAGNAFRQVAEEWTATARSEGESLLAAQKEALVEAGLPQESVRTRLILKEALPEAKKVAAALAIIEEMKTGDYDVVCLGRRGTSPAISVFPGSVAEKVLREAAGRTVWVVD
jgi:nucleotide-binding universal stress UspA family protein